MRRITCATGCPGTRFKILPPESGYADRAQRRPRLSGLFRCRAALPVEAPRQPDLPGLGPTGGVSGASIAILPMYDFPWIAGANDALWAAISARLTKAEVQSPKALTRRPDPIAQGRNPGLIFGQACGYPYVTGLKDAVTLIAAPEYAFPGCDGAAHRSFLVCRARDPRRALGEFRGSTAALNAWDSNTGMNLFRAAIAPIAPAGQDSSARSSSPVRTRRAWRRWPRVRRTLRQSTA